MKEQQLSAQTWTTSQLAELTDGEELVLVLTHAEKPVLRVPVWMVTVGGEAYVRSYLGVKSGWYRRVMAEQRQAISLGGVDVPVDFELVPVTAAVNSGINEAYITKYATDPYRDYMVLPLALEATLHILPAG